MLNHPRIGQRVYLHYAVAKRPGCPLHGRWGTVVVRGKGRPRNHLIRLDEGGCAIVPAGNLRKVDG